MENVKLNTIEEAIEDFKAGNFVIVVDDEDRENEGDLIIAAEKITPEKVNFMLKHARGVLCAIGRLPQRNTRNDNGTSGHFVQRCFFHGKEGYG